MKNKPHFRLSPHHLLFVLVPIVISAGMIGVTWLFQSGADSEVGVTLQPPNLPAILTPTRLATPTLARILPGDIPPTFTPIPLATATAAPLPTNPPPTPPVTPITNHMAVEEILSQLSLEQKIGQMVMVGMPGHAVDPVTYNRIVHQNIGGIILLSQNTAGPEQVRALTAELQRIAQESNAGIPLFIAWNEEGGFVSRRVAGMTHFPSAMALGSINDPALAYAVGQAVGREMVSLGLNMNYAPVLDVNTIPANPVIGLRAFGENPEQVSRLGQQYIAGLQGAGVIAVAKHFPGHGGVDVDSHFALPLLGNSLEQLWQVELPPFLAAIEADVGSLMVAHLQIPALDDTGRPSSLSPNVITQLLRQTMGYDGVIMTDDIAMAAVTQYTTMAQAAVQAVQAGNDLILSVPSATHPDIIVAAILQAVQSGLISEVQINASVRRILRLKEAYPVALSTDRLLLPNQHEHRALALDAGRRAVRIVQNADDWLPLQLPNNTLVIISPQQLNPGTQRFDGYTLLGEILLSRGLAVTELFYDPRDPASVRRTQASALNQLPDAFLVITWDAILRQAQTGDISQEEMVAALLATNRPVIVIYGALPYDQLRFAGAPAQIMMYGDTDGQIQGTIELLFQD